MHVKARKLDPRDAYRLMIACVVPRPIAWISSIDLSGRVNLAPFSFFGGVTSHPPIVMVSIGRRGEEHKDTAKNLIVTGEAVVNIPSRPLAERMVATSAEVPYGTDEFKLAGLTKVASVEVAPPRVGEAAVAMEARVHQHLEIGAGPNDLFLLEILHFHVDDACVRDGLPDPAALAAVGRLGGLSYCDTAAPFEIPRPPTGHRTAGPVGSA